ncbi:MAG: hypothetical protein WDM81_05695 [Rhizomicrobium sp.]
MTGDVEAILETGAAAAVEAAASALAARGTATGSCANCRKPLLGPYCAVCGQPQVTGRRSVHNLLYAFVKDVVNFDSRILRTARALLFQPGELPQGVPRGPHPALCPRHPPLPLHLADFLRAFERDQDRPVAARSHREAGEYRLGRRQALHPQPGL